MGDIGKEVVSTLYFAKNIQTKNHFSLGDTPGLYHGFLNNFCSLNIYAVDL
jgi:hypothetical protein